MLQLCLTLPKLIGQRQCELAFIFFYLFFLKASWQQYEMKTPYAHVQSYSMHGALCKNKCVNDQTISGGLDLTLLLLYISGTGQYRITCVSHTSASTNIRNTSYHQTQVIRIF